MWIQPNKDMIGYPLLLAMRENYFISQCRANS